MQRITIMGLGAEGREGHGDAVGRDVGQVQVEAVPLEPATWALSNSDSEARLTWTVMMDRPSYSDAHTEIRRSN
jgi:hypothetical protein